jgi:hypothetical protein
MKKSKSIMLLIAPILSTLLFNACGGGSGGSEESSRDVYQSREDCVKDWGEEELCEQMNEDDDREYRGGGGVVFVGRPFWGPRYYPGDRTVLYKGRTISATGKSTSMKPFVVTSRSSSYSRSSTSSPRSTSYGGFGSRSSGGSSSSGS